MDRLERFNPWSERHNSFIQQAVCEGIAHGHSPFDSIKKILKDNNVVYDDFEEIKIHIKEFYELIEKEDNAYN